MRLVFQVFYDVCTYDEQKFKGLCLNHFFFQIFYKFGIKQLNRNYLIEIDWETPVVFFLNISLIFTIKIKLTFEKFLKL